MKCTCVKNSWSSGLNSYRLYDTSWSPCFLKVSGRRGGQLQIDRQWNTARQLLEILPVWQNTSCFLNHELEHLCFHPGLDGINPHGFQVVLRPLQIPTWFWEREETQISLTAWLLYMGSDERHLLSMAMRFSSIGRGSSFFTTAMNKRTFTMSYLPLSSPGMGWCMSNVLSETFAGSHSRGGYWSADTSKPSR